MIFRGYADADDEQWWVMQLWCALVHGHRTCDWSSRGPPICPLQNHCVSHLHLPLPFIFRWWMPPIASGARAPECTGTLSGRRCALSLWLLMWWRLLIWDLCLLLLQHPRSEHLQFETYVPTYLSYTVIFYVWVGIKRVVFLAGKWDIRAKIVHTYLYARCPMLTADFARLLVLCANLSLPRAVTFNF